MSKPPEFDKGEIETQELSGVQLHVYEGADLEGRGLLYGLMLIDTDEPDVYYIAGGIDGKVFVVLYDKITIPDRDAVRNNHEWWAPHCDELKNTAQVVLESTDGKVECAKGAVWHEMDSGEGVLVDSYEDDPEFLEFVTDISEAITEAFYHERLRRLGLLMRESTPTAES